jgi:hypothetical protein
MILDENTPLGDPSPPVGEVVVESTGKRPEGKGTGRDGASKPSLFKVRMQNQQSGGHGGADNTAGHDRSPVPGVSPSPPVSTPGKTPAGCATESATRAAVAPLYATPQHGTPQAQILKSPLYIDSIL